MRIYQHHISEIMPKGIYNHFKIRGRKRPDDVRKAISDAKTGMSGHIAWNKGIKGMHNSPDTEFKKGHKIVFSKEHNQRISDTRKRMFKNGELIVPISDELIRKRLRRKEKSSLEIKFEKIADALNLPYKFVGNGEFIIGGKCPDFINCNGEKIAIEVYYRKHKEMFRGGLEKWKQERSEIFAKYGWKILFFDETQIDMKNVKNVFDNPE